MPATKNIDDVVNSVNADLPDNRSEATQDFIVATSTPSPASPARTGKKIPKLVNSGMSVDAKANHDCVM